MKKRFSTAILQSLFLFGLLCLAHLPAFPQSATPFSINNSPLPAPTSPVMDYAGVLDANTKQALERKIIAFRDSSNPKVELAVAVVQTTGDRDIFDYSLAVSRGWKIGSKDQDNPSALLFIAVNDRKYYTQVSRDLEDELPDGLVGQLQRQNLVPAFRQQNYGKGISDTIDAYISTIQSKQNGATSNAPPPTGTTEQPKQTKSSLSVCSVGICLIILIFIILPLLSRSSKKRGGRDDDDRWGGGGFGGGAASALPWVIGSILSSGSGGSSSGGSSGGDSGWGGFGGGGDFGGGGAGGDW